MKLTAKTFQALKNFSSINQSIYFTTGNKIRTISPMKTIMAEVEVDEVFPRDFGIYDLNQFLGVVSLFEEPDLDFDTHNLTVSSEDKAQSDYFYADKSMIVIPPDKPFELPDAPVSFTLSDNVIKRVLQAANVLGLPEIVVKGDGEEITIGAVNTKNTTSNTFKYKVGITDKVFSMVFKVENLKLQLCAYDVTISSKGISQFKSTDGKLIYTIVNEASSSYEG
jgi:hypothetical protein